MVTSGYADNKYYVKLRGLPVITPREATSLAWHRRSAVRNRASWCKTPLPPQGNRCRRRVSPLSVRAISGSCRHYGHYLCYGERMAATEPNTSFRFPPALKEAAREKAYRDRTSLSAKVIELVTAWVSADEDLAAKLRAAGIPAAREGPPGP